MTKQSTTITYTCHGCDSTFAVAALPRTPATYDSPEEGGGIDPEWCRCGERIDAEEVCQMAADKIEWLLSEKYER